jgi:hypothetical protein
MGLSGEAVRHYHCLPERAFDADRRQADPAPYAAVLRNQRLCRQTECITMALGAEGLRSGADLASYQFAPDLPVRCL